MVRLFLLLSLIVATCCGGDRTLAQESRAPKTNSTPEGESGKQTLSGGETRKAEQTKLDTYFTQYCNDTGGLGIGFVASHTYDYKFRQRLKSTTDPELKRLFVLQHLYRDVDSKIRDYERGQIRVGKVDYRKMTPEETETARKELLVMLDDLAAFDPDDPEREIASHRLQLK